MRATGGALSDPVGKAAEIERGEEELEMDFGV